MARSAIMSIRITGNADDAIKTLSKVTGKAAAFGSAVGGLAVKGVTALASGIRNMAGDVLAASDSTQKFTSTMQFAGIKPAAIEQAGKATRQYADQTVYGLADIQNTTAQLAANGIQDYIGLTQAAGNLNAVAGGNAESFKSVAMMLTQTAGAGKLTTENWNQLADAIPGASGRLQEAMRNNGAYTGNFRDAMEKGEISADEFNRALMQLGMDKVAVDAAKSTKTMEGAIGNLQANVVGGLTDLFNLVKPQVTGAITDMAGKVGDFFTWLIGGVKKLAPLGEPLAQLFATLSSAAAIVAEPVKRIFADISASVDGQAVIQGVATAFGMLGTAAQTAAGFIAALIDGIRSRIEPLSPIIVGVATAFAVWQTIQTVIGIVNGVKAAMAGAQAAMAAFNAVLAANPIGLVITAFAALTAAAVWFFTKTQTGRQIWQQLVTAFNAGINNIKAWFAAMGQRIIQIGQNVRNAWNAVVSWFAGVPGRIAGFFSSLPGRVSAFFSSAGASARNAWNAVVSWFAGVPGRIAGFFSSLPGRVSAFFSSAGSSARNVFNAAVSWFAGVPGRIAGFFTGLPGRIAAAFGDAGGILVGAGQRIINGLLDGLKSAWSNVTGFIGGIGDWIAAHKGPASYDARLLVNNGRLIMNGFAAGLEQGFAGKVKPAIAGVNRDLSRLALGTGTVTSGGNTTVRNYSITVNAGVGDPYEIGRQILKTIRAYEGVRA